MAASAVTPTVVNVLETPYLLFVVGTIAVGAGDYATGGLAVSFDGLLEKNYVPKIGQLTSRSGYYIVYSPATAKMIVRQQIDPAAVGGANIPFTELAAAASPAALVADTIDYLFIFEKTFD